MKPFLEQWKSEDDGDGADIVMRCDPEGPTEEQIRKIEESDGDERPEFLLPRNGRERADNEG